MGDVKEGVQIHVSDSGSDFVNGSYTCRPNRSGHGDSDLHFVRDDGFYYLAWWAATLEWPAGWYFEDRNGYASYFHRTDNPSLVPYNLWEPYEADCYCLTGALPAPFLEEANDFAIADDSNP